MRFAFKIILATVTCLALGWWTLNFVQRADKKTRINENSIGKLASLKGFVQVKSGGGDLKSATAGFQVYDGDTIVTGVGSEAKVELGSGRTVVTAGESRVSISSLEDSNANPSIVIDGTRASGVTVNDGATPERDARPIILLTSMGTIPIAANERASTKNTGDPKTMLLKKVDIATGETTVFTGSESQIPSPSPEPSPTQKAVLSFSAKLLSSANQWTTASWPDILKKSIDIQIRISNPGNLKSATISLESSTGSIEKAGKFASDRSVVSASFALADIIKNNGKEGDEVEFSVAVSITDGVVRARRNLNQKVFITSIHKKLAKNRVSIGLTTLPDTLPKMKQWNQSKLNPTVDQFPLVISIVKPGSGQSLAQLLESGSDIGFKDDSDVGSAGTFVVKNQEVIAQISGRSLTNQATDRIRNLMDGDFVFTGLKNALVSSKKFSVSQIQSLVNESVNKGKGVYVFQSQDVFLVNKDFLTRNPSVVAFVKKNSSAFFTSKVTINSFR